MRKYNSYKDSGIDWLRKIPSHWEIKALKRCAKICNGQDHKGVWDNNGEYPILGSGGIFGKSIQFLHKGPSVLLGRKGTIDKPRFVNEPFWTVDTAYYTEIQPNIHPRLFYFLTTTINFDLYKYGSAVPSMTQQDLGQIPFAISKDFQEQTQIANFLDQKTGQIDKLIAQKEKLLKLLAEKRTAVITQAVTCGLDEKGQIRQKPKCLPAEGWKDSGIDWLGEIPKSWEVWKTKHGFNKIGSGTTPKSDNSEYYNGEFLWVTTSELREKHIGDTKHKVTELAIEDYNLKFYEPGAVIIAMYGATIGRLGILSKRATVNQACCVFDEPTKFDSMFLYFWLWMARDTIISLSTGGGQPNLSQDDLKQLRIPRPKVEEQKLIAAHIEEETSGILSLEQKIEKSVKQLKEYREALITAAVTGQIDVRKEAAL
jgi:type I restriction enzyme S subunit